MESKWPLVGALASGAAVGPDPDPTVHAPGPLGAAAAVAAANDLTADDLELVNGTQLAQALNVHQQVIATLEAEAREVYVRAQPGGEVMLSRHDLYPK